LPAIKGESALFPFGRWQEKKTYLKRDMPSPRKGYWHAKIKGSRLHETGKKRQNRESAQPGVLILLPRGKKKSHPASDRPGKAQTCEDEGQ